MEIDTLLAEPDSVCQLESVSVRTSPWRVSGLSVRLSVTLNARLAARRVVRAAAGLWNVRHLCETAEFCVAELAVNAVKHVKWPDDQGSRYIGLSVGVEGPYFVVTVSDPDPTVPVVGQAVDWHSFRWSNDGEKTVDKNGAPESGLGLLAVAAGVAELCGEFGFESPEDRTGKFAYFALPTADYSWVGSGDDFG